MKRLNDIVVTALIVVLTTYLVLLVGPQILGYDVNVVLSNSMEPIYSTGEFLLIESANADQIEVGDIISFDGLTGMKNVITHRVTRIDQEAKLFYTKGDANKGEDSIPVSFKRLNGKVMMNIPMLGYVYGFLHSTIVKIGLVVIAILYMIVQWLYKKKVSIKTH